MINSVFNRLPDTHVVISERASQPALEASVQAVLLGVQVPALLQEPLQGPLHLKRPKLESDTRSHSITADSVLPCVIEHLQDYI